jgi:dethiobiotin synthetase
MNLGMFVTGTDTGVGKTQVAAGLAAIINQKIKGTVQLWKPVQTGTQLGDHEADSYRLASLSGLGQEEQDVVSYTYPDPLAPWMAARRIGKPLDYNALVEEGRRKQKEADFLMIEGAGGLAVPLTESRLIADLAADMKLPILIVARPGLGTVNHTILTAAYARQAGLDVVGIVLNGYQTEGIQQMKENVEMIEAFFGEKVLGCLPWLSIKQNASSLQQAWTAMIEQHLDINHMMENIGRCMK